MELLLPGKTWVGKELHIKSTMTQKESMGAQNKHRKIHYKPMESACQHALGGLTVVSMHFLVSDAGSHPVRHSSCNANSCSKLRVPQ